MINKTGDSKDWTAIDHRVFESIPGNNLLVRADPPKYSIVAATPSLLTVTGKEKSELIGNGVFDVFPNNAYDENDTGAQNLRAAFDAVIKHKTEQSLPLQRYDLPDNAGNFSEHYWSASNHPVLDEEGNVIYILHTTEDVTNKIKAEKREQTLKGIEQVHNLFMQAPVAIHIFKGPELVIELANEPTLTIWDKTNDIIGKPLKQVLPELEAQGYFEIISNIRETGVPYHGYEKKVMLKRNGVEENAYFNFVLQPYYEADKTKAVGVLGIVTEVTDKVIIKKELLENRQSLDLALEVGKLGIFDVDFKTGLANYSNQLAGWLGLPEGSGPIDTIIPRLDEEDRLKAEQSFQKAISGETGGRHDFIYKMPKQDSDELMYLRSIAQVQTENGVPVSMHGILQDVTQELLASKKIEESEERFRTMAEGTEVLIAVGDENAKATYFNHAWTKLTGRSMDELVTVGWLDLVHPDDRNQYVDTYMKAFEKREPFTGEIRVKNADGVYRWLLAKGPPRFRKDGSFAGYISSCVDITDSKQAEDDLRQTEHRLRSIVDSAPFPIGVYTGKEMQIVFANRSIMETWGKGGDVVGKTYSKVLPELRDTGIYEQLDAVFTNGIAFNAVNQRVDLEIDGKLTPHYFNYSFTPLMDTNGNVYGVMNTAANVTDLNIAKIKIEESERNFRNLVMHAPVGICIIEKDDLKVEVVNDTFLELIDRSRVEFEKSSYWDLIEEVREQYAPILDEVFATGTSFRADEQEIILIRNNKPETVHVSFVFDPIKETAGTVNKVMVLAIEVTEQVIIRRRIEEVVAQRTAELANANEALQRNNLELEQFAYIASHDMQEPLRKVRTFTDMLKNHMGNNVDERTAMFMDKIANSSTRMSHLIRDILDYSQVSKSDDMFVSFDLNELIDNIATDFELLIEQKGARIIHEQLPVFEAVPLQMQQLFTNLISNALKFTKPDVVPEVKITADELTKEQVKNIAGLNPKIDYLQINVRDNGIGFDQQYADRIFNIFHRLHSNSEFAGTGIGLAICKKIMENHHGQISATSDKINGTVFSIVLPRKAK